MKGKLCDRPIGVDGPAKWGLEYMSKQVKFCPECGSEDVFAKSEEESRMDGGEVHCNDCNNDYLIRRFVTFDE